MTAALRRVPGEASPGAHPQAARLASFIKKSAVTVAALGALGRGGAAVAGAATKSSPGENRLSRRPA